MPRASCSSSTFSSDVSYSLQQPVRNQMGHTKNITDLKNTTHILRAIRDTMHVAQIMYTSSEHPITHGNISPNAIYIDAHNHATLAGPSQPTDYFFQPMKNLACLNRSPPTPPLEADYLDDMESFYYVLLWMCFEAESRSRVLPCFQGDPMAHQYLLKNKERIILGSGIDFLLHPVPENWGGDKFEEVLDNFRFTIAKRCQARRGRSRTTNDLFTDALSDYGYIVGMMDFVLAQWENQQWAAP